MTTQDNGGPAFPRPSFGLNEPSDGMTLRDYFAAKALSGYMATELPNKGLEFCSIKENDRAIARHCYAIADAMLEARK